MLFWHGLFYLLIFPFAGLEASGAPIIRARVDRKFLGIMVSIKLRVVGTNAMVHYEDSADRARRKSSNPLDYLVGSAVLAKDIGEPFVSLALK